MDIYYPSDHQSSVILVNASTLSPNLNSTKNNHGLGIVMPAETARALIQPIKTSHGNAGSTINLNAINEDGTNTICCLSLEKTPPLLPLDISVPCRLPVLFGLVR